MQLQLRPLRYADTPQLTIASKLSIDQFHKYELRIPNGYKVIGFSLNDPTPTTATTKQLRISIGDAKDRNRINSIAPQFARITRDTKGTKTAIYIDPFTPFDNKILITVKSAKYGTTATATSQLLSISFTLEKIAE